MTAPSVQQCATVVRRMCWNPSYSSVRTSTPPGAPGPFALSEPEVLAGLAQQAGLRPRQHGAVPCPWAYPDLETALRL